MSESAAKSHGPLQVEYRRSKRYHVLRRCLVRPAAKADAEGWRSIIFDFSAYGVGMTLPFAMRPGALVEIVPHAAPGAPALRIGSDLRMEEELHRNILTIIKENTTTM